MVPNTSLKVWAPAANSGTLFLPVMIAPAARSRATMRLSCCGTTCCSRGEPQVFGIPAVSFVSLLVIGTPWSGPSGAPAACRASAASA